MYSVIGADGQLYGPVPMDTLKLWCREGRILPTTSLLAAGSSQMLRASDLRDLQPFFVQPGPMGQTYQGQSPVHQTQNPIQQGHPYIQQGTNPNYPGQPNLGGIRQDPYVPGGIQNPSHPQQGPSPFTPGPTPFQQPNYYGQPGAAGVPSTRSKTVAVILVLIFGPLGIHRFYLGYGRDGAIMLGATVLSALLCWLGLIATTIWSIVDLFKILAGTMPDADGNPLQ